MGIDEKYLINGYLYDNIRIIEHGVTSTNQVVEMLGMDTTNPDFYVANAYWVALLTIVDLLRKFEMMDKIAKK
jgi:hypothetical protein